MGSTRIGILVVAYNAAATLERTLDRIPAEYRPRITSVLVSDDASGDSTHLIARGYQQIAPDLKIEVVRQEHNLGYGGNQKFGYQWAIDRDLDVVVLLHGDGQYAPEMLPAITEPLERGDADAVFGSRMLDHGGARGGGMPLYKFVGNRILTKVENTVVGTELSEWHSGYRAYSVEALREVPFHRNSDGFDFDTQVIVQFVEAGKRIVEVPIPTYYGDEISHVNGMAYARDVCRDVLRYRAHKMGFGTGELAFASQAYESKEDPGSSHEHLLAWLADRRNLRVLDLGCSDGVLASRLRERGHHVTGVDVSAHPGIEDRVDRFVQADLDAGLPPGLDWPFDVVLAADVLEHVRRPERVLAELLPHLDARSSLIASVPNFGHWYPRARVALGRFDYDRRGVLDRDHVRFFTKRSFERMVDAQGYEVVRRDSTGVPLEVVDRRGGDADGGPGSGSAAHTLSSMERTAIAMRPQLFAYQFLFELRPRVSR
jgi:glycosyltransferase involved in cell wall biosynthesis